MFRGHYAIDYSDNIDHIGHIHRHRHTDTPHKGSTFKYRFTTNWNEHHGGRGTDERTDITVTLTLEHIKKNMLIKWQWRGKRLMFHCHLVDKSLHTLECSGKVFLRKGNVSYKAIT